jgi:mannitol 2-dehydrogenase
MLNLNNANLNALAPEVSAPMYDHAQRRSGIAHVGVGHFHRSHQAMYVDRLMRVGDALDWAICGVGVLPSDSKSRDILREQDYLYTLTVEEATAQRKTPSSDPSTGTSTRRTIRDVSSNRLPTRALALSV